MQNQIQINKYRGPDILLQERLKELEKLSRFEYVRYSDFYTKICKNFSITKAYAREFLIYLKNAELIILGKRGFKILF